MTPFRRMRVSDYTLLHLALAFQRIQEVYKEHPGSEVAIAVEFG